MTTTTSDNLHERFITTAHQKGSAGVSPFEWYERGYQDAQEDERAGFEGDAMAASLDDAKRLGEILANPKGEYSWFSCHLWRLYAKADGWQRRRLAQVYPTHAAYFDLWEAGLI